MKMYAIIAQGFNYRYPVRGRKLINDIIELVDNVDLITVTP